MLTLENVSIAYGANEIVKDVSFSLEPGKLLVLIGPNGSGKTTLIKAICGSMPLQQGKIRYDGTDLMSLSAKERSKIVAVVPQKSSFPLGISVFDTVSYGRTPYLNWWGTLGAQDREMVEETIRNMNLWRIREKDFNQISGGEQQRVLLARALVQNTPVLILDEPVSHLDLKYQVDFLSRIKEICEQKAVGALIVLHDLNLAARYADEVMILHEQRIFAHGRVPEVLTAQNLSHVFQLSMRTVADGAHPPIILPAL